MKEANDNSSMSILCIIASEFCERFSISGLRTMLSLYLRNILHLHENASTVVYHVFVMVCYTMPLLGALLADNYIGRYRVILYFSVLYSVGTVLMCFAAIPPLMFPPALTTMCGLLLIAMGTGATKPCVAAFGGDQFRLPEETQRLQGFFSTFYFMMNLGSFLGMVVTPAMRRSFMCFGDDTCYALGFALPVALQIVSIVIFVSGKHWYRIKKPKRHGSSKAFSCAWYALNKRLRHDTSVDGPPLDHWLDYSAHQFGQKFVADMKAVCSVLYLFLPVPIFWSLFDQQGSRWTFQASRLKSEMFGVTLMPDQLQVLNPALVLMMIPFCPGGSCQLLPNIQPLNKMFIGGILTALAFICSGFLQIAIEHSGLQTPERGQTGLILMNTLPCPVEVNLSGEGTIPVDAFGTALMDGLQPKVLYLTVSCPKICDGRKMKLNVIYQDLETLTNVFMPLLIGQNSMDELNMYYMDPDTFSKSFSGKPKLKMVYVGKTGINKNVSITVETDKQLSDVYYVSNSAVDYLGESNFISLQAGSFIWRAYSQDEELSGTGEGYLKAGGVYVLCLRERLGRLDVAVLHVPNPPNDLNVLWAIPQYVLISIAEIMFAVSGLEFSFTQAPKSMKTLTIAAWYVSVAMGNLIVIVVTQTKIFGAKQTTEFFVYSALLGAAMLIFLYMASGFESRDQGADLSSNESRSLITKKNRVISVRTLTQLCSMNSSLDSEEDQGFVVSSMTSWPPRP